MRQTLQTNMSLPNTITNNTLSDAEKVQENFDRLNDYNECPYKASAYNSNVQSIPNNTVTTVELDAENYDSNSNFNTGTYGYTVPVTGYYLISAAVRIDAMVANKRIVGLVYNGATSIISTFVQAAYAEDVSAVISKIVNLAAGDIIYLKVSQNSGVAKNTVATSKDTYLSIHLLST